jgi:hypothetical protein
VSNAFRSSNLTSDLTDLGKAVFEMLGRQGVKDVTVFFARKPSRIVIHDTSGMYADLNIASL